MNTIKIRIALEINPDGEWQAVGNNLDEDWNDAMRYSDPLADGKRYWIEAEVPVPAEATADVVSGNAMEAAA